MKAVRVFLTLIICENWVFQLQLLAANQLMERRQLRLGNYNYNYNNNNWRPTDCNSFTKNYQQPAFTRQHDIALFNATPSAHDLTQKYQVMYFPKEASMPGRSTLVSSPFLFYKMLLPRPQQHGNGLENLANTGAHLFPTEESMADMLPEVPASMMTPPAMTDATNAAPPPAMNNMNVQTRNYVWNRDKYRQNMPTSYQQRSRMQNSQQSYDFFNQNFAQLEYLQNNPKNIDLRLLVEQTPLYRTRPRQKPFGWRSKQVEDKRYLPLNSLHMQRNSNSKMNILDPPFQASPFAGYVSEPTDVYSSKISSKFIPLKTYTQDDVNFIRSQQNSHFI